MNINQLSSISKILQDLLNTDMSLKAAFKITAINKEIKEQLEIFTEFQKNAEPESWSPFIEELSVIIREHKPANVENFNVLTDNFYQLQLQEDAEAGYEKIKKLIEDNTKAIDEKITSINKINESASEDLEIELTKISIALLPETIKPIEFETIRPIISETDEEIANFFEE